jgi:hypothetical protein
LIKYPGLFLGRYQRLCWLGFSLQLLSGLKIRLFRKAGGFGQPGYFLVQFAWRE